MRKVLVITVSTGLVIGMLACSKLASSRQASVSANWRHINGLWVLDPAASRLADKGFSNGVLILYKDRIIGSLQHDGAKFLKAYAFTRAGGGCTQLGYPEEVKCELEIAPNSGRVSLHSTPGFSVVTSWSVSPDYETLTAQERETVNGAVVESTYVYQRLKV